MISSGLQLQYPSRRNFQVFNALHPHDLLTVSFVPDRDHRFDFCGDRRGCADELKGRPTEISNPDVSGCCFRNRWYRLQPGVFNFDWNVVRQDGCPNAAKEQKNKPSNHFGEAIVPGYPLPRTASGTRARSIVLTRSVVPCPRTTSYFGDRDTSCEIRECIAPAIEFEHPTNPGSASSQRCHQ